MLTYMLTALTQEVEFAIQWKALQNPSDGFHL